MPLSRMSPAGRPADAESGFPVSLCWSWAGGVGLAVVRDVHALLAGCRYWRRAPRPGSYDMDVPAMYLEQHERRIHVVRPGAGV